jgi:hypothetical protein
VTNPLDHETWSLVAYVLKQARRAGMDETEALHKAGLLLTAAKKQELHLGGMQFLHREVVSWRPAEFLRMKFQATHQASPADMYACIVEFLEKHIAEAKKK